MDGGENPHALETAGGTREHQWPKQVVTPLNPPFDEVDRLPEQRMKGAGK
jgi:hypothetical protein